MGWAFFSLTVQPVSVLGVIYHVCIMGLPGRGLHSANRDGEMLLTCGELTVQTGDGVERVVPRCHGPEEHPWSWS